MSSTIATTSHRERPAAYVRLAKLTLLSECIVIA
jgi:hypothetical protein